MSMLKHLAPVEEPPIEHTQLVFIAGHYHRVSASVAGEIAFLRDLNGNLATRCAKLAQEAARARAAPPGGQPLRWTAVMKAGVVQFVEQGPKFREIALEAYGLTDEELDDWISRHQRFGVDGLMVSQSQKLREAR